MTFELLENARMESTYGIFRFVNLAGFSGNRVASLGFFRRDGIGFGIDTPDGIWSREHRTARHDGSKSV